MVVPRSLARAARGWAWGASAALLLGACFEGEFSRGLVCEDAQDCGPGLDCVEGLCGGLGELARCGNGLREQGEDCDDGNADDSDDCTSSCTLPVCGDSIVHVGVEACDDGNADDSDDCTSSCQLAVCGDGFVHAGVEACDDANTDDGDDCTSTCALASCGDGIQNGEESDRDCGGSCQPCAIGRACEDDGDCVGAACRGGVCVEVALGIAAGRNHTCARLNTGVRCWGLGLNGQLGYGTPTIIGESPDDLPKDWPLIQFDAPVEQLVLGAHHTCARLEGGAVYCWGEGKEGRLGYGGTEDIGDDESPADAGPVELGGTAKMLAAGDARTCALLDSGDVRCWGRAWWLGYGDKENIGDDEPPADAGPIDFGGHTVHELVAGPWTTCVRLDDDSVRCWGSGAKGKLGYGDEQDLSTPRPDPLELGGRALQLAAGSRHTCALLEGGTLRCWGEGNSGRLGNGGVENIGDDEAPGMPGNLVGIREPALAVDVGHGHACALLLGGAVRCWGLGSHGVLGLGPGQEWGLTPLGDDEQPWAAEPIELGELATVLAVGEDHSCVVSESGRVRCWGGGDFGRLGHGSLKDIGDDETPAGADPVPCLNPF